MPCLAATAAFFLTLLITLAANGLGVLRWRAAREAHWTEQARKLFPIRRSAALNIWLVPAVCTLLDWIIFPEDQHFSALLAVFVAGWVGATLGTYPLTKALFPEFSFYGWLRSLVAGWLLRSGFWGVLIFTAVIMPEEIGWEALVLGALVLAFQIALSYGLWVWVGSKLGIFTRAQPSEPVSEIVRRTSQKMQIPWRVIWKWRSPIGYAAALPITGDLIFSDGLLNTHPDEEIAAITAHELAHLNEPRNIHRARLISSLSFLPFVFIRPAFHIFDWATIAFLWIPAALFGVYTRQMARRMEERADSIASGTGEPSVVYTRALERLYRNNHMPAVMPGDRHVHPHLYDRMITAGTTPDYPRPEAPQTLDWTSGLLMLLLTLLFTAILAMH